MDRRYNADKQTCAELWTINQILNALNAFATFFPYAVESISFPRNQHNGHTGRDPTLLVDYGHNRLLQIFVRGVEIGAFHHHYRRAGGTRDAFFHERYGRSARMLYYLCLPDEMK